MKIAIVGKMCSGKSTLANTIKIIDKQYTIYSIGGKVKEIACDLFNMKTKLTGIKKKSSFLFLIY